MASQRPLHVGIVGAGIGGLAAAVSLKHNGGDALRVTLLEAAAELGEIGAGIQMTPNVAQLLQRWGVAPVIGPDLVEFEELNLRRKDGTLVSRSEVRSREWCGIPWWIVHRMHLHSGLAQVARQKGVEVHIGARVDTIDHTSSTDVNVRTEAGGVWSFDFVIGADGLNSVVRKVILPNVKPEPPTGNAAYRAIIPMDKVRADPITRPLVERKSMDVWMGKGKGSEHGYIISYPISDCKDFNIVLSHHRDYLVNGVETVSLDHVKETYKDYDLRIRRVIDMIDQEVKRWPLMVTRCPTWSNASKNIVLMGDAAHSMVNHLAQGAATSMEDGAFLGVVLAHVAQGKLDLRTATELYEKERMPLADIKQQLSYINGQVYHLEDGSAEAQARDRVLEPELRGEMPLRSPNLFVDPYMWRTVYNYDPERHANRALAKLNVGAEPRDSTTHVTHAQTDIFLNWFMPGNAVEKAQAKL